MTHSPVEECLAYCQFKPIMNRAPINILVQVFLGKNGIAITKGRWKFNPVKKKKKSQTVLKSVCTIWHSQEVMY